MSGCCPSAETPTNERDECRPRSEKKSEEDKEVAAVALCSSLAVRRTESAAALKKMSLTRLLGLIIFMFKGFTTTTSSSSSILSLFDPEEQPFLHATGSHRLIELDRRCVPVKTAPG